MNLQDVKESLQNTLMQIEIVIEKETAIENENLIKIEQELYSLKEISAMFKISKQQVCKLFKQYGINTIDIAIEGAKRPTLRVSQAEVARFREALKM